ncbi:MAG: OmpA-OmpF porin, family, partial [Myxococcales bacterium]|nr:OmpA-OmpF porin, family [Myxococcales bacterium]
MNSHRARHSRLAVFAVVVVGIAAATAASPPVARADGWGAPAGAPDRDKDGIPDSLDACPDTPGVKQADMHKNGCPLPAALGPWGAPVGAPDRDKDGIADAQ